MTETEWFWSVEDEAFLTESHATLTVRQLAQHLGCTYKATAHKLERMGLRALPERAPASSWTEERIERAKTMWAKGHSASQIAAELKVVSRNAVIGKAGRLGWKQPPRSRETKTLQGKIASGTQRKPAKAPSRTFNFAKPGTPVRIESKPPQLPPEPEHTGAVVSLEKLSSRQCHFPVGDPSEPDFGFCAAPKDAADVYCGRHKLIAYRPQPVKAKSGRRMVA